MEPLRAGVDLREAGIAIRAALAAAQRQRASCATTRIEAVVDVDVFGMQRREPEAGVGVFDRGQRAVAVVGDVVGPALAQHVQRGDQVEVVIELAAAAAHQLQSPAVGVVGQFVDRLQAGGIPAIQPGEGRHPVLQGRHLAVVGVLDLGQRLVATGVEIAAFDAAADAGATDGPVAQACGVDAAWRRGEVHLDRNGLVLRVLRLGTDLDQAEVIQRDQRAAQAFDLGLVIGLALVPVDQLVQQRVADDRLGFLLERRRTEQEALAAGPAQVDVGGEVGARHLNPVGSQIGIEIAVAQQRAGHAALARLVLLVVEHLALARHECGHRLGHGPVGLRRAVHANLVLAYSDRLAQVDFDDDVERASVVAAVAVASACRVAPPPRRLDRRCRCRCRRQAWSMPCPWRCRPAHRHRSWRCPLHRWRRRGWRCRCPRPPGGRGRCGGSRWSASSSRTVPAPRGFRPRPGAAGS
jgi:hypothetical protein